MMHLLGYKLLSISQTDQSSKSKYVLKNYIYFYFRSVASSLRNQGGRNCVESGFSESLTARNKELLDLFSSKMIKMKENPKESNKEDILVDERGYAEIERIGVYKAIFCNAF